MGLGLVFGLRCGRGFCFGFGFGFDLCLNINIIPNLGLLIASPTTINLDSSRTFLYKCTDVLVIFYRILYNPRRCEKFTYFEFEEVRIIAQLQTIFPIFIDASIENITHCNLQIFEIVYIVKAKAKIEAKVEQSLRLGLDRGQGKDSV